MEPTRLLIRLPAARVRARLATAVPASMPDRLVRATVQAAAPGAVLSAGAGGLVEEALRALATRRWRVPTA